MERLAGTEIEPFAADLTVSLAADLVAAADAADLARAVAACAAAAENFCGERPMACGPGCPYCCVLNAAVLLPEALRIADWLQCQLPPTALAAVRNGLARHCCSVRWMEDEARIFQRAVCPFLDEGGSCSIHPVRPLVCRAAASLDRDCCRDAFRPFAEQARDVPVDLLRQRAFDAAFIALAEALRQHGFDDRSIELGTGVLAMLERVDCRRQLLSGERLPQELWQ